MLDLILATLKNLKVDAYLVTETNKKSVEMFFIKHELDMTRNKDVTEYKVTVYKDVDSPDGKKRGCADCFIHFGMEKGDVAESIKKAYFAAGCALNPFYELVSGRREKMVKSESTLSKVSLVKAAKKMGEALFENDTDSECFVNSAEIFACCDTVRIVNSLGLDVAYDKYYVEGEFVTQCLLPKDVELYKHFSYDELDTVALSKLVASQLKNAKDRASASKAPDSGNYDCIIAGEELKSIINEYYVERTSAEMIYPGYSSFKVGDNIFEGAVGEKLNLVLDSSVPYSKEGIKLDLLNLVNDGKLEAIHGSKRFCSYLSVPATGNYDKMAVSGGSVSFEAMTSTGKVIYPVTFSDFSVDSLTGRFAGEIRLAYLYNDGEITIVTGGSVSGSIIDGQKNMIFSTEKYSDSEYEGPFAVKLSNVNVAGE